MTRQATRDRSGGLLRAPGLARLLVASCCSETAEWMLQIALPVLVNRLTGTATSTAAMMIAGLLPAVLISPVAGMLVDRLDRRRLLCALTLAQGVVVLPLLFAAGTNVLVLAFLVMTAQAAVAAICEPARTALVPDLVPVDRRGAANGLLAAGSNVARLCGASLGGILFAMGGLPLVCAGYAVVLVLAFGALVSRFAGQAEQAAEPGPLLRGWLDGLRVIRRERLLRATSLVLALMALSQGFFLVLFVSFVLESLRGDAADVGLLRGVQAVGGLLAGLLIATVARRVRPVLLLGWGNLTFAVLAAGTWNTSVLTTAIGVYIGLFTVVGAPAVAVFSGLVAVLQTGAPTATVGRVLSTAFGASALWTAAGMATAGVLGDLVGVLPLLNVQAGLYLLAGLLTLTFVARHTPATGAGRSGASTLAAR